jgi:cobalt transporter subunit CbtB
MLIAQSITLAASTRAPTRARVLAPAFFAALLGVALMWGVGFSHADAFHNAAHDTRHSNGFPCH